MKFKRYQVPAGKRIRLKDYNPDDTGSFRNKDEAEEKLFEDIQRLAKYQDTLYAQNTYGLLIVIQAMDAAGKDSAIKHVFSGVNPQGCQVCSFKTPSAEELDHDYLWRYMQQLPNRGNIGIFNRSYYEEVLVVRVHKELLERQQLPKHSTKQDIWQKRFDDINAFERYLHRNGIIVLKFYLHLSKHEQKRRFLERIDDADKNWKFSPSDMQERQYWNEYMRAYEDVFHHTSTSYAPWYIVPADNKWYTHVVIGDVIVQTLKSLKLRYPSITDEHRRHLQNAKELLQSED
jgi:PPK2 family polyphosphate:nucleotide phosphotransferase